MPNIKSSADLRNNYNEISSYCHSSAEPVFITKNGKGDLAVMSIEAYEQLVGRFELYSSKLATPISNGGLDLTPPGYFTGSARGGVSQYHFYWLPPKEGVSTFFRPLTYHFLLVPEYTL